MVHQLEAPWPVRLAKCGSRAVPVVLTTVALMALTPTREPCLAKCGARPIRSGGGLAAAIVTHTSAGTSNPATTRAFARWPVTRGSRGCQAVANAAAGTVAAAAS